MVNGTPAAQEVRRFGSDDGHGQVQKFKMREFAVEELGLEKAAGVRTA